MQCLEHRPNSACRDIDRYKKKRDGFFIIYGSRQDVEILLLLLLPSHIRNLVFLAACLITGCKLKVENFLKMCVAMGGGRTF